MSSSTKLLEKLVRRLFSPLDPSALFIESLEKFLQPQFVPAVHIDRSLGERSQRALALLQKLPKDENTTKLVYVFLCLSSKRRDMQDELRDSIKQGALGFETSCFNSLALSSLKLKISKAVHSIIQVVYNSGLIYKSLKLEQERPSSLTHRHFLDKIKVDLAAYERSILEAPNDCLGFYAWMYAHFRNMKKLNMLNDHFRSKTHLNSFTPHALSFTNVALAAVDPLFENYVPTIYKLYNECTVSYLSTGIFQDPYSEYFIKNHVLDYGLIPPFISKHTAETIAYLGKYTAFLKSINRLDTPREILDVIARIDLSKTSTANHIRDVLIFVNGHLRSAFFEQFKIFDLFQYIHATFLFGRIDFIERLFTSLKESRKTGRKNFCNLLESALSATFPKSPFNSLVDIFITQDAPGRRDGRYDEVELSTDSFSLYIKLEYPVSLLIEEGFVIKLVHIFKYLWKLRTVDRLAARTKELKYFNIIQKLQFYAFNEVIGSFSLELSGPETFSFDIFKKSINKKIDDITARLFIGTREKRAENMLVCLERYLLNKAVSKEADHAEAVEALRLFYESSKDALCNTYLFDLQKLIYEIQ